MDIQKAKAIAGNAQAVINYVLGLENNIRLYLEPDLPFEVHGFHDFDTRTIHINQIFFDEFAKYDGNTSDFIVNFAQFVSIVAHETRHVYQADNKTPLIEKEFITESLMVHTGKYNHDIYDNLGIEIDCHAFQRLFEEHILEGISLPLPEKMDKSRFQIRYDELKKQYANRIVEGFKKYFN